MLSTSCIVQHRTVIYSYVHGLDQSLTPEHSLPHFAHDIRTVASTEQDDTPSTPAHASSAAQTMDEVDGGVGNVVQDDMPHRDSIDASRSQICSDNDLGVGESA